MKNSVIICTRNRVNDLKNVLDSLKKQELKPDEIIIVDSSDRLKGDVKSLYVREKSFFPSLIYTHTKPGLTYQRNQGVKIARYDIVHFLDDDVVLDPAYVSSITETFKLYPEYAGGMGAITNLERANRGLFFLFRTIFFLSRPLSSGNFTFSGLPTHPYGIHEFKTVQVLGGCCMAYRRSILQHYSFDEQLKGYAYMEDCDISCRISMKNLLFFNPQAQVKHFNSPINRAARVDNRAMYIKHYIYLFFKNFYPYKKIKIVAFLWSVTGLFLEALLTRDFLALKGYIKGIKYYLLYGLD